MSTLKNGSVIANFVKTIHALFDGRWDMFAYGVLNLLCYMAVISWSLISLGTGAYLVINQLRIPLPFEAGLFWTAVYVTNVGLLSLGFMFAAYRAMEVLFNMEEQFSTYTPRKSKEKSEHDETTDEDQNFADLDFESEAMLKGASHR